MAQNFIPKLPGPVWSQASPTAPIVASGVYNASSPAPLTGNVVAFQLDSSGKLKVNAS